MTSTNVEVLENLERRLKICVAWEDLAPQVEERLRKVAKNARIDGFRTGKVPHNIVRLRYGDAVWQEVASEAINNSFKEAITAQNLAVAGSPTIDPINLKQGMALECVATFEVLPEITFNDCSQITIDKLDAAITEKDIDNTVTKMQKTKSKWQEAEKVAANGDRLLIDVACEMDGKEFKDGSGSDWTVELGSGSMIPGFEDGLIGASIGEQRVLNLDFPQAYTVSSLAGKPATFTVTIKKILAAELPPVDEEFVKSMDIADGKVESLRSSIKEKLEDEALRVSKNNMHEQVLAKFLANNPIVVPETLVHEEIHRLEHQFNHEMEHWLGQPLTKEQKMPHSFFREKAKHNVSLGLLLAEFIKQHDIKLDDQMLHAKITAEAARFRDPEQAMAYYYQNEDRLSSFKSTVLQEQAIASLLAKVNVITKTVSFTELLNSKQEQNIKEEGMA